MLLISLLAMCVGHILLFATASDLPFRKTECDVPCGGGLCLYEGCQNPVSCGGGLCKFINCVNPTCGGIYMF